MLFCAAALINFVMSTVLLCRQGLTTLFGTESTDCWPDTVIVLIGSIRPDYTN